MVRGTLGVAARADMSQRSSKKIVGFSCSSVFLPAAPFYSLGAGLHESSVQLIGTRKKSKNRRAQEKPKWKCTAKLMAKK